MKYLTFIRHSEFYRPSHRRSLAGVSFVIEAGRAQNSLHRQRLNSDPSDVQPMLEDDVNH
jgi:hypothetical protein